MYYKLNTDTALYCLEVFKRIMNNRGRYSTSWEMAELGVLSVPPLSDNIAGIGRRTHQTVVEKSSFAYSGAAVGFVCCSKPCFRQTRRTNSSTRTTGLDSAGFRKGQNDPAARYGQTVVMCELDVSWMYKVRWWRGESVVKLHRNKQGDRKRWESHLRKLVKRAGSSASTI
jgi:hypothetical protein